MRMLPRLSIGRAWAIGVVVAAGMLAGCDPATYGSGTGLPTNAGVERTFSGVTMKTFAAPLRSVGTATLQSLNYMDIALAEVRKNAQTWDISAAAGKRMVDIHLEAVTPKLTFMRVMVDQGDPFMKDAATATEIVLQTGDALGSPTKIRPAAQTAEQPAAARPRRRGTHPGRGE